MSIDSVNFIAIDVSYSAPDAPVVSILKEEIVVEEDSSLFLQEVSHDIFLPRIKEKRIMYEKPEAAGPTIPEMENFDGITVLEEGHINEGQPLFDIYYSDDEQQAYPTFDHYKDTEEPVSKKNHPMVPIYDEYESDSGKSQEEEKEPEEQLSTYFIPEPVSKQPLPEINEPTSFIHPPMLIRYIWPHVRNSVAEEAACHQFSEIRHSFYDPVGEYMEWHVLYAFDPPYSISTSPCEKKLKSVSILLSRLHYLLVIIDRRKELLSRKLLKWLWWKFSFT